MPVVPRAIQSTLAPACHGQLAFTVNVPSPPPTAMFCVVGVMVKAQLARPSWVTVTCCSPMLMTPARAVAPRFSSAVKLTPASPGVPVAPDVMCSQFVSMGTVTL